MMLNLQVRSAENFVKALLPSENLVRIAFVSERARSLDDFSLIPDLISKADQVFTNQAAEIAQLLDLKPRETAS